MQAELLDQVRQVTPAFFEQLIIDLVIAMGYGTAHQPGQTLGQSGDKGVDGVINQDPLGVDQIYLQAKRYAANNTVGSNQIRDFYDALNLKRAQKGIFITTSSYTHSAIDTAHQFSSRIVLIDGGQLTRLMLQHNIGCRSKATFTLKKLDEDYFDADNRM